MAQLFNEDPYYGNPIAQYALERRARRKASPANAAVDYTAVPAAIPYTAYPGIEVSQRPVGGGAWNTTNVSAHPITAEEFNAIEAEPRMMVTAVPRKIPQTVPVMDDYIDAIASLKRIG